MCCVNKFHKKDVQGYYYILNRGGGGGSNHKKTEKTDDKTKFLKLLEVFVGFF